MTREPPSLTPASVVPTLADVARLAKVSTATVSRCLNSPDQVIERTRARVMEAVKDLGYAPNFSARSLAAKQTNTIGAVIPTMENAIFARGIQAFQEELGRHGYTLLVASSSYQEALEEEQIRTLAARGADGLLLIGYHRADHVREFLKARNIPTLLAWAYDKDGDLPAIGFSNKNAMADLARIVFEKGHRQVGMISAHSASNDRARDRLAGVMLAAAEAGLDPDRIHVIETTYGIETGAAAFRQLMAWTPRPTVVFCGNDVLAFGALRAAKEMGMSVPDDVSITGFDGIELASFADPPLTTVHVPHREMGRRAAGMLVEMVTNRTTPDSVELQTDIRLRRTLGPPPS